MADPFGFLKYPRKDNPYRPVAERVQDWEELQTPLSVAERKEQAARCMNCGIPFCHTGIFYGGKRAVSGCPNDNLIPEWNDFVYRGDFKNAFDRLVKTNPLPEMTGRVCPAPCEKSCTEGLNGSGVAIHDNERFIIDQAFENDWVKAEGLPVERTAFKVAIVGSGPAGLSAAWRLNQLGHQVTVYERSDRAGGLLMYGIPNMKLDKAIVQRRIDVMEEVGIHFVLNTEIGSDISAEELQSAYDRVILASGASVARDLKIPGRELTGIHLAVDYLTECTKQVMKYGKKVTEKPLAGKHVVVIGGGDTGNDCIGSAIRQGAASVKQLEITPQLPGTRIKSNPWPEYSMIDRLGYGQAEGLVENPELTVYSTSTKTFIGAETGKVSAIETVQVDSQFQPIKGTEKIVKADLVLLAMGFTGAEKNLLEAFAIKEVYENYATNNEKVYVAGDARRGPSLVIWGIREGRKAAEEVDQLLRTLVYQ
ncbi:glutamate synthase subunit beta [Enterococcus hermanniensis]|uniref:Glutamate synthase, NADH/NADPH, small subunit n=1 Tax=Enterococcus hermanniensis TaxID=249189 RepID=A0A1L8TR78_9ENTE|nr:glutamate synthase subunit beta [Enterococcus hermanniensis]OJG46780.1 glutamate synthase, NADH/NADPH, small subunit [Enterococcus hermanniensis]